MIKFAFLPIKRKSYTLTKAPMAHKTNSKEQFVFKFFKFKACIQTRFTIDGSLSSVNASV
jgi:ribosomal protein S10